MSTGNTEPVLTAAGAYAFVSALIAFLRMMGYLQFNDEQTGALMALVEMAVPVATAVIAGFWARNRVTPVADPKAHNLHGHLVDLVPEDGSQLAAKKH